MKRIYLVRHAEPSAAWGGADADPGLSDRGRMQARAAALKLDSVQQILSSPMRRCLETAAPSVERLGKALRIEPRVSEVAAPDGAPDRRAWLAQSFPWGGAERRDWAELDPALHAWRDDVLAAVRALPDGSAVFTHFIALNAIVGVALGRSESIVFTPAHASITTLWIEDDALSVVELGAQLATTDVL